MAEALRGLVVHRAEAVRSNASLNNGMTILEARRALRSGEVSSEELVRDSLRRILLLDPRINAFITVSAESAIARARQLDSTDDSRGCLSGIPIALKDLFHVRGVRTTAGSKVFADHISDFDSTVVKKLDEAGAVLIGKTGLHECAYGVTSNNPHFGAVHNPWDITKIPGGSSGGSGAAVAAGMVFAAMGTDTGGSIRIPASYCGVVGLKPTFGRISKAGVMPLAPSLDHVGPLTQSVRDAALLLQATADPRYPLELDASLPEVTLKNIRVGMPENFFFDRVNPEVASAVRRAACLAEQNGAQLVPVRLPDMQTIITAGRVLLLGEAAAVLGKHNPEDFGQDVRALLDQGRALPATDYIHARERRRAMRQTFAQIWKQVDCLITPTTPVTAPAIGATEIEIAGEREDVRLASTRFVRAFNVLGIPAISIPCGFNAQRLPIGLQIVTKAFSEPHLLRIAAGFEQALGLGELIAI